MAIASDTDARQPGKIDEKVIRTAKGADRPRRYEAKVSAWLYGSML